MPLNWICESVRLSLFSPSAIRLSTDNWQLLTGLDEAETEQKGSGRHLFSGPALGAQFNLGAVGNRCDCILGPLAALDQPRDTPVPSIGHWPSPLQSFQTATETFLSKVPFPVSRLAFASTLFHPTDSVQEASQALGSQVISLNQPPEGLQDVVFRINWPRNSTSVNHLTINRITTWQVQQITVQVLLPDGPGPTTSFAEEPVHVLRLDVDHNTEAKRTQPFDANQLVPIYRELTNLALQNAEKGELR